MENCLPLGHCRRGTAKVNPRASVGWLRTMAMSSETVTIATNWSAGICGIGVQFEEEAHAGPMSPGAGVPPTQNRLKSKQLVAGAAHLCKERVPE